MANIPGGPDDQREEIKAAATDVRAWLGRRGCLFWGVVVIGGLYVLGSVGSESPSASGDAAPAPALAAPPLAVTAVDLFKAFEANEVAAQAEYGNRVLAVTGTINEIALDITDDPVLRLRAGSDYDYVTANFTKDDSLVIGRLSKGQKVTVTCSKLREVLGTPVMQECAVTAK